QSAGAEHILLLDVHLQLHVQVWKYLRREFQRQTGWFVVDYREAAGREWIANAGNARLRCSGLDAERISLRGLHGHALSDARCRFFTVESMDLGRSDQLGVVLALEGAQH